MTHQRKKNQFDNGHRTQIDRRFKVFSNDCAVCLVTQSCLTLFTPWTIPCQAPLSMEVPSQEDWSRLPFPSPGDLPNPGIEPRSPPLQANSLLTKPPRKPKNTEVGSLTLLQEIFPTQESNQGFLHCRQILYQLTFQGSPI